MHVPFPLSSREQALHLAFLWALLRFRLISCVLSFMPGRTCLFVMCMCEGNGVLNMCLGLCCFHLRGAWSCPLVFLGASIKYV